MITERKWPALRIEGAHAPRSSAHVWSSTGRKTVAAPWSIVSVLLLLVTAFYLATPRDTFSLIGDDSAQYIHHAKNLALGLPFGATGYVYNPEQAVVGPPSYPPVVPFLLAPVYYAGGGNVVWLQAAVAIWAVLLAALVFGIFRRELNWWEGLVFIVLFSLNPVIFEAKSAVLSDLPFCLFVYLCLYFATRLFSRPTRERRLADYLWLAISFYLAFGSRTVGVCLLPAIACDALVRERRLSKSLIVAVLSCAALVVAPSLIARGNGGYSDQLVLSRSVILANIKSYLYQVTLFWEFGFGKLARHLLFGASGALTAYGAVVACKRRGLAAYEWFAVFYIAAILVWPANQGIRFLLPLFPLYLFYILTGFDALVTRFAPRVIGVAGAVALGVVIAGYAVSLRIMVRETPANTLRDPAVTELFSFINEHTPADARIAFTKPRVLSLLTDRSSGIYPPNPSNEGMEKFMEDQKMSYLIIGDFPFEPFAEDKPRLEAYAHDAHLEKVFSNRLFEMYRKNQ